MIAAIYILIALWLAIGLAVAIPFALAGADKLPRDPAPLTTGVRVLLVPGAMILWPLVLCRWIGATRSDRS